MLRQQLEDARPRYRAIDVLVRVPPAGHAGRGSVLAAAVAFRIFLFVVPYVFVIVYGFGLTSSAIGSDPRELAREAGVVGLLAASVIAGADQVSVDDGIVISSRRCTPSSTRPVPSSRCSP